MSKTYTQFEGIAGCFAYDAIEPTTRRKPPRSDLRSEDDLLPGVQRDTLISSARDAKRNYAIPAWMIRKHLDFVSDFSFQANTPDREWNKRAEDVIRRWSKRKNCHVGKRHRLGRLLRLIEVNRTCDGDTLVEKLKGLSINVIRGDRIRNPRGIANTAEWKNGVRINPRTTENVAYAVWKRTNGGRFIPDKEIPARNAILHGYFEDSEHTRGISPMSTAINSLRDTYEGIDLAMARLKAEMVLGIAITKDPDTETNPFQGNDQFGRVNSEDDATDDEIAELEQAQADEENKRGVVRYGRGLFQWELAKGEDVKSIGGNMPSSNAQGFLDVVIQIAMKSLDLPFSFFREDFTNFYGSRGALQLYKRSAQHKQADNQELLDELTKWVLIAAIVDGELDLPRGWRIDEIETVWVPRGIPWWDRAKEIRGDLLAIGAGLDTPQNICLEHGSGRYEDNIEAIAQAVKLWQEKIGNPYGIDMNFVPQSTVRNSEQTSRRRRRNRKEEE